jgi:hypothetical protein
MSPCDKHSFLPTQNSNPRQSSPLGGVEIHMSHNTSAPISDNNRRNPAIYPSKVEYTLITTICTWIPYTPGTGSHLRQRTGCRKSITALFFHFFPTKAQRLILQHCLVVVGPFSCRQVRKSVDYGYDHIFCDIHTAEMRITDTVQWYYHREYRWVFPYFSITEITCGKGLRECWRNSF